MKSSIVKKNLSKTEQNSPVIKPRKYIANEAEFHENFSKKSNTKLESIK